MTDHLPTILPTEAEHAAEVEALAVEDAAGRPLTRETWPDPSRRERSRRSADRVALALAAAGLSGSERLPATRSERPLAASLGAWAADPVATLPPLRLRRIDGETGETTDPGDATPRGSFALSALARAVAPDLAARGWVSVAGGRLAHDGAPASADVLAETVAEMLRAAAGVARGDGLSSATEPAPFDPARGLGAPRHRPARHYSEHLSRLAAHADRETARADVSGARAEAAWWAYDRALAAVDRQHHDDTPARFAWPLLETLADLVSPRNRRTLAALVRDLLPAASAASVEGSDVARAWLASLAPGAYPRPALWEAYAAAGSPGDLGTRPALYALATEVLGPVRTRRGVRVFVAEAAA